MQRRLTGIFKSYFFRTQKLAQNLYAAVRECGDVNLNKIHEILEVPQLTSTASQAATVTEAEFLYFAWQMRPFTEQAMKIEVAPWIQNYVVNMDELYTELTLEKVYTNLQGEEASIVEDYRELFARCLANRKIESVSGQSVSIGYWFHRGLGRDDEGYLLPTDINRKREGSCCLCFGGIKSNLKQKLKKMKSRKYADFEDVPPSVPMIFKTFGKIKEKCTQSYTGEKILAKGDPGMGKTTWCKKIGWDWARGLFKVFSVVFFVFLKFVQPGASIESIILEQNSYMKGMKMTEKQLENILETFGNRCLLILDGLDEHALGSNQDVLRIIKREKLLSCNIIVTSRPHSTKQIQQHFPVIVRVDGFTYNKAEQFTSKILRDKQKIEAVLNFNPTGLEDSPVHKCPILLSFLCLLVREDDIDLSTSDMHIGEIYYRMVRCLYKKFTIRKGLDFRINDFNRIMMLIGKLAFETLLSGNPLLQRSRVLAEVGEDAFDYGLLIGHEDAHKLIRDITADIFITFPHRSLQEFLGAFFFIWMLNENAENEFAFAANDKVSKLMKNPLFVRFCLWLLKNDEKYPIFENSDKAYNSFKPYTIKLVNCHLEQDLYFRSLNTESLAQKYPALDIKSALAKNDELQLRFLRDIIGHCNSITKLVVESIEVLDFVLNSVSLTMKSLTFIKCEDKKTWIDCFHENQLVLYATEFSSDLDVILKYFNMIGLYVHVHLDNRFKSLHLDFVEKPETLCVVYREKWGHALNVHCPYLTHLHLEDLDAQGVLELSQFAQSGRLQSLSHLSINDCDSVGGALCSLFKASLPELKHLNLLRTRLDKVDLKALSLACNSSEKTLPNLSSLCLYLCGSMRTKALTKHLFSIPWLSLKKFYMQYDPTCHPDIDKCLQTALPNLKCLAIDHKFETPNTDVSLLLLNKNNQIESLMMHKCCIQCEPVGCGMNVSKISKLEMHSCRIAFGNLSLLLQQISLSFHTLILSDCGLTTDHLSSLAGAGAAGRLPELKHLDLSDNKTISQFMHLFDGDCTWKQLLHFDIRRTLMKSGMSDFMEKVQTDGLLGSLQELAVDIYPNVNTHWPHLKTLYVSSDSRSEILDIVDRGCFPFLRTICFGQFRRINIGTLDEFKLTFKKMRTGFLSPILSAANIDCHEACPPFETPFSSVRCYCQKKFSDK